jgi:maltose alpha-D-glucosyltransferase / alpha-amylase
VVDIEASDKGAWLASHLATTESDPAPLRSARSAPRALSDDPRWYERAVFYEISPRGFFDSNGDGVGDIGGIIERLDYLAWLGVDCLWLLPFYPSPLRDGGYDVEDFHNVAPECGTVDDVRRLITEAHARGIRVISDLVLNHTSDQHPWFLESRSSRDNPKADWYVWSDDDQRWSDIRIIFTDTEPSNWTFDPARQQYYWHRFFHHQPDLNYENPEVRDAIVDVVRFWLDLGLDGFRLDAAAYLFQRDDTSGENLPETHAFLRRLRAEIDRDYPNRVLLAEVNQWPADVVDYFGDGDECHMCFHFPLMPRMFMAVRREQRLPVTEILAQTPTLPPGAQWGIFLRNHDELTLEMVTDEERDYMYAEYAHDPRMRKNLGIRRRLAPLLENDRRVAELLHAMLLSLPGAPILYYGDEILMGDNIYLGDRDTVRTPMQWTPDRNGGFSTADFAQLYLPPLMDPVYGFQAVNVEAETRNASSFLHWLQRMLAVRRQHALFATGAFEVLPADNPSILAYARFDPAAEGHGRSVICVNNLSRFAQSAELGVGRFSGAVPVELIGRATFPTIGPAGYPITVGPHGFYWLEVEVL